MCIREDIVLSTKLVRLTPQVITDAKIRNKLLRLCLAGIQLNPFRVAKKQFCDVEVHIENTTWPIKPKNSYGIICQQDSHLRFLYYTVQSSELHWFITCGGSNYCAICQQEGQANFSWLQRGAS